MSKNMIIHIVSLGIACMAPFFSGCINTKQTNSDSKFTIVVSILPQKFFVEKICGANSDVIVMVEPGASPHAYEPKPSQIAALANAQLYFSIGMEFEKAWLPRFRQTAPGLRVVALDSGIEKIIMESSCEDHAGHGADELKGTNHLAGGFDPHIWLGPAIVAQMAERIASVVSEQDTVHAAEYQKNKRRFLEEIGVLQDSIKIILAAGSVKQFLVYHPSWGYFAAEFGLHQISIEEEGKEPQARELISIIDHARSEAITTIFVQPQNSYKTAEKIASQIGGRVVPIDPLAYDWDKNLITVATILAGK